MPTATANRSGTAQFGESSFYATLNQSSVSPGNTGTFTLNLTAPTTPNTYTETWRMYSSYADGNAAFGHTATVQIVVPAPAAPNAQLISESVPAGTQKAGGTTFTEVVTDEEHGQHDLDWRCQRLHAESLGHGPVRRVELLRHAGPEFGEPRQQRDVHAELDRADDAEHVYRDLADAVLLRGR